MTDLLKTMVKECFDFGWADKSYVAEYVKSGDLTAKEYEDIVGEPYEKIA